MSRVSPRDAHHFFLRLCDEAKIAGDTWPFCTETQGLMTIRKYVRAFFDENYDAVVESQYGQRALAKSKVGTGHRSRLQALRPLDVVEMDEHTAHFLGCIGIPTPGKGLRWVPVGAVQIILLVDRFSRAILSYLAIFTGEANSGHILVAVGLALEPWRRRKMLFPELLGDGAGFPSEFIDELSRCGFASLLVDNALSHLARDVVTRIIDAVGCAVNFGPTRKFERRSIVERVFKALEGAGFMRLPSTTGSNPQDPLRQNAEAKAAQHKVTIEAALDLIESTIAEYNATDGEGNFALSPLKELRDVIEDGDVAFIPPYLPERLPADPGLATMIEEGRIGGNRAKGVRPHIYLDRVAHTNPDLALTAGRMR